ncbi:hypothetical protein PP178_03975 [Zeaxanthinibacter sp. PT1]|uniref:hypothetical protein n=1 Tax=Zeaxanthinibacter TaxID=561554 RepID=UPI00234B4AC1|nr:hypothetical protein [Zeaxanthinibacter sp. PT1]MDC6350698.1 hypothetical protein [Zeaxanthinibacter sp. PT1]
MRINLPAILISILLLMVMIAQCQKDQMDDRITTEVTLYREAKVFVSDTVYLPEPVETIIQNPNNEGYKQNELSPTGEAKDGELSLPDPGHVINTYREQFRDSLGTTEVHSEVRGTLLRQFVTRYQDPYTITIRDTVSLQPRHEVFAGFDIGVPVFGTQVQAAPMVRGNLLWKMKNKNIMSIALDTYGYVWLGYNWKL